MTSFPKNPNPPPPMPPLSSTASSSSPSSSTHSLAFSSVHTPTLAPTLGTLSPTDTNALNKASIPKSIAVPSNKIRDRQSLDYVWRSLLAGGVAGCAAKTAVAPLDRVKILFQTNNPHFEKYSGTFFGVFRAAGEIHKEYGSRGLFQGHSATLLRIFPYAAIKFMAYEQIKHRIMPTKESQTAFRNLIAGSIAGCTSVFFSYPLDLLRVRLAFEVRSHHQEVIRLSDIARMIYQEPSPFFKSNSGALKPLIGMTNFYRGFMPTLYGIIPYAGKHLTERQTHSHRVSFLIYERLKTFAKVSCGSYTLRSNPRYPEKQDLTWWAYLTCGALSGAIAQTCAYPFEVIRRNMQVAGVMSNANEQRRTTAQTASYIYARRGLPGFFVGLSIGYMKVMPMSAVSFFVYEWMKNFLGIE
ncbi:mitochondrial carrier protein LEU5 [Phlyctochytrium arcticum]|nr:mitochondrial carrier protein LEU5 [Phlyctochytrium arcticum]